MLLFWWLPWSANSRVKWVVDVSLVLLLCATLSSCMPKNHVSNLKEDARDIFYHGYDNYMRHAFPEDELRPLTCGPLARDRADPTHIELNDVLGNYSLTLIDSLSTLAILASSPPAKSHRNKALDDFQDGIALLVEHYGDGTNTSSGAGKRAQGFDLDSKVQVFETVIRGVGGLLSAHLFAVGDLPITGYSAKVRLHQGKMGIVWRNDFVYDGQLLRLAHDLGRRLLPAFSTATGMPYPRVNLKHGVPFYLNSPLSSPDGQGQCERVESEPPEITETCSAGAGSLVLEFTTLSRLTGDWRFEIAAKQAFWAVWNRRSSSGLIGSGIDAETGQWISPYTGIGAGIDSFFEYAFKSHILLSGLSFEPNGNTDSSDAFLQAWHEAHEGIKRHIYRGHAYQHPHYVQVDLYTGALRAYWIDSLSAYYPGLLTLAGHLDEAIETHLLYAALWTRYSALPERWSTASGHIEAGLKWWGGRPEFIESTWYLYRATKDPFYLYVGEMTIRDIRRRCWTKCGWAGLQDVRTGELSDRMESFFLGETAKYLFLLFDQDHPLNNWDAPYVFTTEGHPLIIPKRTRTGSKSKLHTVSGERKRFHGTTETCPTPPPPHPLSFSAAAARTDIFHAASLAKLSPIMEVETVESALAESTLEHSSLLALNPRSPSNHSYYPWTLPPEFVPWNASSSKMAVRSSFDLSFPNVPNTAANGNPLTRVSDGILVLSMSGLRLGMVREDGLTSLSHQFHEGFRIHSISNLALGRDEKVYVSRDTISTFNPTDPYFTRVRDLVNLDLLVDTKLSPLTSSTEDAGETDLNTSGPSSSDGTLPPELNMDDLNAAAPSLFSNFFNNIQNLLVSSAPQTTTPPPTPPTKRSRLVGILPTGPGAAPLPGTKDGKQGLEEDDILPWRHIYVADEICHDTLPRSVPKDYQILIIKRGGCSFSQKLQNIPTFAPDAASLQLVIVVSFAEHEQFTPGDALDHHTPAEEDFSLVQPLLDSLQFTPSGLPRPHPIPLVMVGGGEATVRLFEGAQSIGVRRRWHFATQGLRIANLVVL